MKKLIVVANDAPQTGKTSFVRVLEQYYERQGIDVLAIHTDPGAAPDETAYWDLDQDLEPSRLLRSLKQADVLILDIASGEAGTVTEFFADYDFYDTLLEHDVELTAAVANNGTTNSNDGAVALAEGFSDNAEYILLHSPYAPESEVATAWAGSYGEKVMGYLGAVDIKVPEFDAGMSAELDGQGMDLATGLFCRKDLPRFLRDALHSWELEYAGELDEAVSQLVPDTSETQSVYENSSSDL